MKKEVINISKREYLCLLLASEILINQGKKVLNDKYDLSLNELVIFREQLENELNSGKKEKNIFMFGKKNKESLPKRIAKAILYDYYENGRKSMLELSYDEYMKDQEINEDKEHNIIIIEVLSALTNLIVSN